MLNCNRDGTVNVKVVSAASKAHKICNYQIKESTFQVTLVFFLQ